MLAIFVKTGHLSLHRRVTAYYLLFGVAAIACLAIGLPALIRSLKTEHIDNICVARVEREAAILASAFGQDAGQDVQSLVEKIRQEGAWVYCAVMDSEGHFSAHSSRECVGQSASPSVDAVQIGAVECIRSSDDRGYDVREYRTPLKKGNQQFGTFCAAIPEPALLPAASFASGYTPLAILAPGLAIAVGTLVVWRVTRPIGVIENQLRQIATSASPGQLALQPVVPHSSADIGWNRLVENRTQQDQPIQLQARLSQALDGFRHRKAEQILNSLPEGVAVTDQENRISFANQALVALLSKDGSSLDGKSMYECLALEAGGKADHMLLEPESRMRDVVVEMARPGDQTHGILRVARYPLRTAEKNAGTCHIWSVRDITQQKLADQMRNQFVYSATHELRTPLANIRAYAETLSSLDVLDVEKQKEFCNIINAEATRLSRFIDDLLSISRMQAGSLSLDRQLTDIHRLLHDTVENVRPRILQKQMTLDVSIPDKLPEIKIDKDKIAVTLVNLLGNAAKYTPNGGHITLAAEVLNNQLCIHVEDTGIGISIEDLPKVFDKFFRSADPRVQDETGSGLGLSLAHEVVRLHGGKLTVNSELNKGTRFTLALPL